MSDMDKPIQVMEPFKVGFVLVDGFALLSYASAVEPLLAANRIAGRKLYHIRHMPAYGARATSASGAIVAADTYLGEDIDFDLVLVVAGEVSQQQNLRRLEHWLRVLSSRQVLVGGVSSGPLILIRAGVMQGHRLTLHRDLVDEEKTTQWDNVIVEKTLFVHDRGRLSCAGGTAAMDMMQALITEHHGGHFANQVSQCFIPTDGRSIENPQIITLAERYDLTDVSLLKAIQAMENHLDDPLTLTQLSGIVGLSVRQINRLFRQHIGRSTQDFYTALRLEKSLTLLRDSLLSVGNVALATGFASSAHFGRHFRRAYGMSPSQFRSSLAE